MTLAVKVMQHNGFVPWANMLKYDDIPLKNNNFKSKYSKNQQNHII
jgi:hypothetical protein